MSSEFYKRTKKPKKEINFNKVLQLVVDGGNIKNAILSCGFKSTAYFYRQMTKEQKDQLYRAKILNTTYKRY